MITVTMAAYHSRALLFIINIAMTFSRSSGDAVNLTACLLVERNAPALFYNFDRSAAAIQLALDYANEVILPENITLRTVVRDVGSSCLPRNHAVALAMDLRDQGITCNVYIGPGCGYAAEALYDVASSFDKLIIGCPAGGVGTSAPLENYPFLTRISITHTNTASILIRFLREYNYTTPVIFHDVSTNFYEQMGIVVTDFIADADDLSKVKIIKVKALTMGFRDAKEQLSSNKLFTRVFILLTPSETVRNYMLAAKQLKMTDGDYVFLGVNLFPSTVWGNFSWSYKDSEDLNAKDAFRPLLLAALSVSREGSFKLFSDRVKKLSLEMKTFRYENSDEVDIVTSHFYDSVIYYASLVRDLNVAGRDFTSGLEFANLYPNYSFTSPLNGLVKIAETGDRLMSYVLQNFDASTGIFQEYKSYMKDGTIALLGKLQWPNGNQLPPNAPYCGFLGNDPRCAFKLSGPETAAAVIVPLLMLFTGILGGILYIRRFMYSHSDPFWWRISEDQLTFVGRSSKFGASSAITHGTLKSGISEGITTQQFSNDTKSTRKFSMKKETQTSDDVSAKEIEPGELKEAIYCNNLLGLRDLSPPFQRASHAIGKSLFPVKRLQHQNIQQFYGIVVNDENLCEYSAGEMCRKGTLTRLLLHDTINLDWTFKSALFKDSSAGMNYLHSSSLVSLGNLSSHSCIIDSNFVLKLCDYGLSCFHTEEILAPLMEFDDDRDYESLFWRAPEFLRQRMPPNGTQKGNLLPCYTFIRLRQKVSALIGDIYSYAIILQQILLRSQPYNYGGGVLSAKEILLEVKKRSTPPVRPRIPVSSCPAAFLDLIEQCWDELPVNRPPSTKIRPVIMKLLGKAGDSVVEHLITSMEKNAAQLEFQAEERTRQFMEEKARSDDILSQILPKSVAMKLTKGLTVLPETYSSTTVQFSSVCGFTELLAEAPTPLCTVKLLNLLYSTCDEVIDRFDVYKVEMVKDAYLIVSGIPVRNGIRHADEITSMGLMLKQAVVTMKLPYASQTKLKIRIGIHSGSCVAGVIGTRMPRYCLFGDTVNTASRMESHGEPGKIQCSYSTKELLDSIGSYMIIDRGEINIKGKGAMKTHWVIGKDL